MAKKPKTILKIQAAKKPKAIPKKPAKASGKKPVSSKPKPSAKKKAAAKKRKSRRLPVSAAKVKAAAFECESMPEAAAKLSFEGSLAKAIKRFAKLSEAWKRGRFLRNLSQLASTAATVNESAEAIGIEPEKLRELLRTDPEVADTWNQARLDTTIKIKTAMVSSAIEGKPTAIKNVEKLLASEIARPTFDYRHISISQLCEITGRTRQTIHTWYSEHGLGRNSDLTFNLRGFLEWFAEFTNRKTIARGGASTAEVDPLKVEKIKKMQREHDVAQNQLLDRKSVIAGQVARHQNLVNMMNDQRAEELVTLISNQPIDKGLDILKKFFAETRRNMCSVGEEMALDQKAKKMFIKLLDIIEPEGSVN